MKHKLKLLLLSELEVGKLYRPTKARNCYRDSNTGIAGIFWRPRQVGMFLGSENDFRYPGVEAYNFLLEDSLATIKDSQVAGELSYAGRGTDREWQVSFVSANSFSDDNELPDDLYRWCFQQDLEAHIQSFIGLKRNENTFTLLLISLTEKLKRAVMRGEVLDASVIPHPGDKIIARVILNNRDVMTFTVQV